MRGPSSGVRTSEEALAAAELLVAEQADLIRRLCIHAGLPDPLARPRPVLQVIEGGRATRS